MAELRTVPTAAELLDAPERALELSPADAMLVLARVGALEATLRACVAVGGANGKPPHEPPDHLLTPEDVAVRLSLTVKQVYRRARRWPFTRRPSEGTLRFSERGLERWIAGKRP